MIPKSFSFIFILIAVFGFGYDLFSPYEIKERIDYNSGLVFLEKWSNSYYLGIEDILTFKEYLDYQAVNSIKKGWKEKQEQERKKQETEFGSQGLIPDIDIPKLPIFGEGSKINISGSDKITFGGRQTTVYGEGVPQSGIGPSLLPELKMDQELRVNLDGSIGDKTKIVIDHDSEREFEGKNKIKLSYTGTEDEIVQSIEMGDTRLTIPGTNYTGDLPAHKGLFGVSAKGKIGGLDLYAVASTEQSQAQTTEFRGQTQMTTDTIYDHQFERKRFYLVDTLATQEVKNLQVYVDQRIANPQNYYKGLATINPDSAADTTMGSNLRFKGKFILLKHGVDYYTHSLNVVELTYILGNDDVLAVSYVLGSDTIGGQKYIETQQDTYVVLKLLKPSILYNDSTPCWNYELRNIYRLGDKEVTLDSLRLYRDETDNDVELENEGPAKDRTFISILGLDPDGDGKVIYPQFDKANGIIIFPNRFPFINESLSVKDPLIYKQDPLPPGFSGAYYMVVRYSSSKGSFSLNQIDIEENSEKVYVNQNLWTKDVDYRINYSTGELSFLRILPPNADIRVTFEYRPWISASQKSLLGTRGEWKFLENGKIGSSIFYRSEGTPGDKPQLGAEPFRRLISEVDLSYGFQSQAVSSFLNKIPLLRADAPSSFSFSSEAAISLPDPNTRGLVYLDDFEGSTISSDIRTDGIFWSFSSVPVNKDTVDFANKPLIWFNPTTKIRKDSIFGTDIGDEGRDLVDYLRIVYAPDNTSSWAGIMQCPSQLGMDFRELENLEVVLRTRNRNNGKIHITVGTTIDEDAPRRTKDGIIVGYNGIEDTEDRNGNGILDIADGEDTGLDTVLGKDSDNIPGDDGNDDYDAKTNPSGKEGNGGNIDGEDLDRNGFSPTNNNNYIEYTIDLADAQFFENLKGDWRFLRIPLLNSGVDTVIGNPRWEDIKIVRIWFDGFTQNDTIDIYSISFVGSKWRNVEILKFSPTADTVDSTEKAVISLISNKTDTAYFPPFEPKRDYTGRVEIEASLKLTYAGIKTGHLINFDKLIYDKEDYRDYKTLKLYIHNDINDPVFFLKLGSDTNNYYEYKIRISEGQAIQGRDNWYEFEIPVDTFPKLKQAKLNQSEYFQSGQFAVMGSPSLAEIRYQAMGIENHANSSISGAIWFNDVRLHDPRKEIGYGFNSRIGVKFSDFVPNLSFGINISDPNFRRFSEGRGVKTDGYRTTTGFDASVNLHQLLPRSWNFNLPFSYRKSSDRTLLKFSSYYPDLRLTKTDAAKDASTGEAASYALSNVHKGKSKNRLLNYTLEAFNYSWQMNTGYSRTPLNIDSTNSINSNLSYGISPDLHITLFGEEVNLFPQSIQTGIGLAKTEGRHWNRPHPDSTRWVTIRTDSSYTGSFDTDVNYNPLEDLSFDYNFSQDRDLLVANPKQIAGLKIGQELGQDQSFGASYELELGEILSPRFDFGSEYHEDRIRNLYGYSDTNYKNIGNGSDIDLSLDVELPEALAGLGKLRDESKDSSATLGSPQWLLIRAEDLSEILEPIDFSYSKSRNTELTNTRGIPDWKFRFGFSDNFVYETIPQQPWIDRNYLDNFQISSGANFKDLNVRFGFSHAIDKNYYNTGATGGWQTTWPDFNISIAQIERFLKKWVSSSNISMGYSQRRDFNGTLDPEPDTFYLSGQIRSVSNNFSPLFSWQANWKNRISTNLAVNYSKSKSENFLGDITTTSNSYQRSGTFSLSYSFSAPKGLKIPGLKRIRFSSDLSLSWSLRLSENYSDQLDPRNQSEPVINRKDRDISTSISASYRVSRSVESGLTSGYSLYRNLQRKTNSRSIDLNFWVLFRF